MKIFFILNLMTYLYLVTQSTIRIDVTSPHNLSLSKIAEKVTQIPLKGHNINPLGIQKVIIIKENIYVLQRYKEFEIQYSHVFKYTRTGNFLKEIEVKDPATNENILILDMQFNATDQQIFLLGSSGYGIFDNAGSFLYFRKRARTEFEFLFNCRFWSVDYSHKNGFCDYSLVYTDLEGQNKDTIKSIKYEIPGLLAKNKVIIYASPSFSVLNNELFMSFGVDNKIYKVDRDSLVTVYRLDYRNRPQSEIDIFLTPEQLVFSRYVKCGYFIRGSSYYLLYDKRTGESYNIKEVHGNDSQPSGIQDDIFNTGNLNIIPTNIEDYVFFFRKPDDFKGYKMNDLKNFVPTIFLVKLKN